MTTLRCATKKAFLAAVREGAPSAVYEQNDDGVVFRFEISGDEVIRTCVGLPDDEPDHITRSMLHKQYRVPRDKFDEAHVDHLVHGLEDAHGPLKDGLEDIMTHERPEPPEEAEPEPDRWAEAGEKRFLLYVEDEPFYDDLGVLMFPLAVRDQEQRGSRDWAVLADGLRQYVEAFPDEMVWHRRMLCCLAIRAGSDRDGDGDYPEADRFFELARSADPNDLTVRTAMGASLTARGRIEEALEHFEAVIRTGRFDPEAWKPAIAIYETLGTEEAKTRARALSKQLRANTGRPA